MVDYPEALVREVFSSAFVDEGLFVQRCGGSKTDPEYISRYLTLPIGFRPELALFFDREFYWQKYPDIHSVDIDPLVHFMRWGIGERRVPHPLIDIDFMLAVDPKLFPDPPTIDALQDVLSRDLIDPGPFFSLEFYRRQLDGSDTVDRGLLHHFLETGILHGLKPSPGFDPVAYYRQMDAKTFDIRSGLRHFVLTAHAPKDVPDETTLEGQAKAGFRTRANATQLLRGRSPLQFGFAGEPELSVIVVMHGNFILTLQTLASLRANYPGAIELILIDSGSTDETRQLGAYISGAVLLRFDSNISFVRGCNAALEFVNADAVLYLNNDVELAPDAILAALRRLRSNATIGAVGAKVIRTHGLLQEAGCIIWRDGWTAGYLRDQSPLSPEANFVRDVDFCSAVFLLVRAPLLKALGGFDVAFAPAYFEDADLGLRIQEAGYRVVYDPAVIVHHLEYGTSQTAGAAHHRIREAHDVFVAKHQNRLQSNRALDIRTPLFARSVNKPRGTVLLIEDRLPLRRLGSGFVRTNDIVGVMARLGYQVTVYPIHANDQELAAVYADFPDTVEVMHDRGEGDLEQFLKIRRGYYDTIWIARSHNLDIVKPMLDRSGAAFMADVRIVLDTEAIGATRDAQQRALSGFWEPVDPDQAMRTELRNAYVCQIVLAVNAREAEQLRALDLPDVRVLGHLRALTLTPCGRGERSGMLFVGALHGMESPNYDSLCWFVDAVLPLIEQQLGWETRLTIAGFATGDVDLSRFLDHPRVTLRGAMADMTPLYETHRVFVAPTRYAAGLPHKVHEAASHGVPVVTTELLRQQLGWESGRDLLSAEASNPVAFAEHVLALYRSETLWNALRAGAAERIRAECGREAFERVVAGVLG
jgi:GT2 family glycosyltransferase